MWKVEMLDIIAIWLIASGVIYSLIYITYLVIDEFHNKSMIRNANDISWKKLNDYVSQAEIEIAFKETVAKFSEIYYKHNDYQSNVCLHNLFNLLSFFVNPEVQDKLVLYDIVETHNSIISDVIYRNLCHSGAIQNIHSCFDYWLYSSNRQSHMYEYDSKVIELVIELSTYSSSLYESVLCKN